jgi:ketosteroid isomerase-like protein
MSANVELVRRMFDAFASGGFAAVAEFMHPGFEGRQLASHPLAAASMSADALARSMTGFMKSFEDFGFEAEDFADTGGDRVAVRVHERGRPRGGSVELDQRFGILYTLRDGKVFRMEWFDSFEEALAAAGTDAAG